MEDERQNRCRAALKRWLNFASDNLLRHVSGHPELAYYGTGESAHWAVQSNMNVVAALAVAGVEEADPAMVERALSMRRLILLTIRSTAHRKNRSGNALRIGSRSLVMPCSE